MGLNKTVKIVFWGLIGLGWLYAQPGLAEGLQRLFMTPAERYALNEARVAKEVKQRSPAEQSRPKLPPYITLNGFVIRSSGVNTVWVNDSEELYRPSFKVGMSEPLELKVPIELGTQSTVVDLKPGQTVNTLNGDILEVYEPLQTFKSDKNP